MCTNVDEEHDEVILMEKFDEPNLIGKWCRKCVEKTQATVVLRKKDAYCKLCFLSSVRHKFRACLGKSKTVRPGDKVVIGFSGSNNSVALLHLIRTGLQDTTHKKLMFEPFIVYVDDGAAVNLTTEEINTIRENINEVLKTYEYPTYRVPLELSFQSEEAVEAYLARGSYSADDTTLSDLFNALPDITSRTDLLSKLRNNVLVQVARSLGCNKVFTAETADDLAVKLLTNVSLGRGAQLPYDVSFSDDRLPEVKVVRPLRDLSKKELVFYNIFHDLTSVHVPSLLTKVHAHSSIQKLTESFLCDLQDGFPSTLSTVFRVADKLTTNSGDKNICPICKAPLDVDTGASSSLHATQFSRIVSSLGSSNFDSVTLKEKNSSANCCSGSEKTCGSDRTCHGSCSNESLVKDVKKMLCYGCSLILKNADMEILPIQVVKYLQEYSNRYKMKKEIEEFLL